MLRFAEAGQVRVNGSDDRALVSEVDLDLTEVLPLLQQMRRIGMAQGMDVRLFGDGAGLEGETKGPLQRGAGHRLGGGACSLTTVTLSGKEQDGMAVGFPLFTQEQQRAFGQGHVAILVAFAGTDVQEHALRIDIADLQAKPFTQAQAAGVDGGQSDAMIQGGNNGEDAAHFRSGEDDGEFKLGIGPSQFQLVGPVPAEGLFPKEFDGADGLRAGLAGDLLVGLQMDAILTNVLGAEPVGGFAVKLTELTDAGVISLFGAGTDGQKFEVIGEGF
jgi:hypothetical protein